MLGRATALMAMLMATSGCATNQMSVEYSTNNNNLQNSIAFSEMQRIKSIDEFSVCIRRYAFVEDKRTINIEHSTLIGMRYCDDKIHNIIMYSTIGKTQFQKAQFEITMFEAARQDIRDEIVEARRKMEIFGTIIHNDAVKLKKIHEGRKNINKSTSINEVNI